MTVPRIPVLVYHRVGEAPRTAPHPGTYLRPSAFARQLWLLKTLGYRTVSARAYADSRLGRGGPMPEKPLLITFDDGSETVHSAALPALERHGFTAVVFVVASQLGGPASWDGELPGAEHRQLTADELKVLVKAGWSVGSHTLSHPRLTGVEAQQLGAELSGSKRVLEAALGAEVPWFAYPYGAYDARVRDAVSAAGYEMAFATEDGDGHRLSVPRRVVPGDGGLLRFLRRLQHSRRLAAL